MVADHEGSDRNGDGKDSLTIWNELFSTNTVQQAPFGLVFNANTITPSESVDGSTSDPITHGAGGAVTQFNYSDGCSMTLNTTANSSVRGAVWASATHTNSNVMVAYGTFGSGKFVAIGDSSPIDDGTGNTGDTLFDGWDSGNDGELIINASLWLATPLTNAPPANDSFSSAATLTGSSTSVTGTNVNATNKQVSPIMAAMRAANRSGGIGWRHRPETW